MRITKDSISELNRDEIADLYFEELKECNNSRDTRWRQINMAILMKYKLSGLEYIKNKAWKLLDDFKSLKQTV